MLKISGSCFWLLCILLLCPNIKGIEGSLVETKLLNSLLENYNTLSRPVANISDALTVKFGITVMQILHLVSVIKVIIGIIGFLNDQFQSETEDVLKAMIWRTLEWTDTGLVWDPAAYENISDIRIPPRRIWTPDITAYNSALDTFESPFQTDAVVRRNGTITFIPPGIHATRCEVTYSNFPFDEHNCTLKFGSWTYDAGKIDLQLRVEGEGAGADVSSFIKNADWDLFDAPSQRSAIYYACCKHPYIDVTFTLRLRRRGEAILQGARNANAFIAVTLILSFLIPSASGHKITFALIHVICAWYPFWCLMSRFPNLIQRSNDNGGPLVQYYRVIGTFALMGLLTNVFTVWLYHSIGPMPRWVRNISLKIGKALLLDSKSLKEGHPEATGKQEASEPENTSRTPTEISDWQHSAICADRIFFVLFIFVGLIIWVAVFPSY